VCAEDEAAAHMSAPPDCWRFGFSSACDVRAVDLRMDRSGMRFELVTPFGAAQVVSPLVGRFNALNLLGAACGCLSLGLSLDEVAAGLASVVGVPGRLELVPNDRGLLVVVDYAHTEESLEAVLGALREITTGRLWVVFGCGGDRDTAKRPRMGAVASLLADRVVVTSDNPRSEPPLQIMDAILSGMGHPPALAEPDREQAIRWALTHAMSGDVVLLAGKGHETYQEQGSARVPFDDRAIARAALEGR
jgi:UDP-N-acetylmuramoyl-L-alanyl-D-glutamate--2,6-diaminopimelate ligase